jgi:hypothetical protein
VEIVSKQRNLFEFKIPVKDTHFEMFACSCLFFRWNCEAFFDFEGRGRRKRDLYSGTEVYIQTEFGSLGR